MTENMFQSDGDDKYDRLINADGKVLRSYAAKVNAAEAKEAEVRGRKGSIMKEVEEAEINKEAFKLANKLSKAEPTKAQEFMKDLLGYSLVLGVFDQLNLFSGDQVHNRVCQLVAILHDQGGEVGLDVSVSDYDQAESDEDDDVSDEAEASGEHQGGTRETPNAESDEDDLDIDDIAADANGDDIDAQPENSGQIFNSGVECSRSGGAIDDCPFDGRSKEGKLWKQGFNSVTADDETDEVPAPILGETSEPFPSEDAVH